jgi:hypothetical protein
MAVLTHAASMLRTVECAEAGSTATIGVTFTCTPSLVRQAEGNLAFYLAFGLRATVIDRAYPRVFPAFTTLASAVRAAFRTARRKLIFSSTVVNVSPANVRA